MCPYVIHLFIPIIREPQWLIELNSTDLRPCDSFLLGCSLRSIFICISWKSWFAKYLITTVIIFLLFYSSGFLIHSTQCSPVWQILVFSNSKLQHSLSSSSSVQVHEYLRVWLSQESECKWSRQGKNEQTDTGEDHSQDSNRACLQLTSSLLDHHSAPNQHMAYAHGLCWSLSPVNPQPIQVGHIKASSLVIFPKPWLSFVPWKRCNV